MHQKRGRDLGSERLRTIVELVGMASIVVSLVLVAFELRENTRAMEAGTRLEMASQDLVYISAALDSNLLAQAVAKQRTEGDLSDLERSQLRDHQHLNFRIFENAHYQFQIGALDEAVWNRYVVIIGYQICMNPAAKEMWHAIGVRFTPDFSAIVNGQIARCREIEARVDA